MVKEINVWFERRLSERTLRQLREVAPSPRRPLTGDARGTLLALAVFLFFGCETAVDWDFKPQENGELAVEAILTNELKNQEVVLSLTFNDLNGEPQPATGAQVRVRGAGETHLFAEDPDKAGRYVSQEAFAGQLFTPYSLEIEWEGQTYEAEAQMVQVLPFQPVTFSSYGATDSVVIGNVPNLFSPHEQALYIIDIDWSHLIPGASSRARLFYYTFNTVDVSELFRPPQETVPIPRGSVVVQSKYSLAPGFAAYIRALAMENEWQGGFFDESSATPPTNVSNGGQGYFGVCAVVRDTLVAE